ncbi:hypothetical protein Tco_0893152 [Tanacetum coccineum]|uniref:Uncharacterized protein n=1 Tax=Tanacetum coccineum TaxID=301880 RepID=A0ABQ5C7Z8_9ASTR
MTKIIKEEFEKIKDVKVEDASLTCDTSLKVFNNEFNQLSEMDDDSKHEVDDDMGYDLSDVALTEWLGSKFFNYKTMDHYIIKALWIYWIRGDDEVELTDEESSDDMDEVAEIFRIDTNLFDFETPMKLTMNLHYWKPTPLSRLRVVRGFGSNELKDEALRNKAIMDGFIKDDDDESYCKQMRQWNIYTNYDDAYEINHEDNEREELCEDREIPVCNIRRYMMIKYPFNNDKEYVAVKEDEYDDLMITREEAC